MGGIIQAIKSEWLDREIDEALTRYQEEVENKERIIVGMNEFIIPPEEDVEIEHLEISYERGLERVEKIKSLRRKRDNEAVEASLKTLYGKSKGDSNIMPYVIDAVSHYATIGEVMGMVRLAHGNSYDPSETLSPSFPLE